MKVEYSCINGMLHGLYGLYALRIPTQMLIGYFVHCTYIHMHITKQPVGDGFWDVR